MRQARPVFFAPPVVTHDAEHFRELDKVEPTHVINAAGCTGRPNVDWCEEHQIETIRYARMSRSASALTSHFFCPHGAVVVRASANVLGALTLADLTNERGIHLTNWSTGCIYTYDNKYPIGKAVTELDPPNFAGSFYSKTKVSVPKRFYVFCYVFGRASSRSC